MVAKKSSMIVLILLVATITYVMPAPLSTTKEDTQLSAFGRTAQFDLKRGPFAEIEGYFDDFGAAYINLQECFRKVLNNEEAKSLDRLNPNPKNQNPISAFKKLPGLRLILRVYTCLTPIGINGFGIEQPPIHRHAA